MATPSNKNYEELEKKYKTLLKTPYGFETPQGWFPLLEDFLEKAINFEGWFKIVQIKEKFGGLRIYIDTEDDIPDEMRSMIEGLIMEAEFRASRCCHDCGDPIDRSSPSKHKFFLLCNCCASTRK